VKEATEWVKEMVPPQPQNQPHAMAAAIKKQKQNDKQRITAVGQRTNRNTTTNGHGCVGGSTRMDTAMGQDTAKRRSNEKVGTPPDKLLMETSICKTKV
jgi:hypothetical protein